MSVITMKELARGWLFSDAMPRVFISEDCVESLAALLDNVRRAALEEAAEACELGHDPNCGTSMFAGATKCRSQILELISKTS